MIELVAHTAPDNLIHKTGRQPEPDEVTVLECLATDFYTHDFCQDNHLQDGCYSLVFDTHAELVESHFLL